MTALAIWALDLALMVVLGILWCRIAWELIK